MLIPQTREGYLLFSWLKKPKQIALPPRRSKLWAQCARVIGMTSSGRFSSAS